MSAASINGSDGVRSPSANGTAASKQHFKSGNSVKALEGARKQAASPADGQNRKQQAQPKAWQGPNPITQRASSAIPNGTEKPLPKLPQQVQTKNTAESRADKHAHDRLLYILANFKGRDAKLTLKNGEEYTGVFSGGSFDPSAKNQYTLKMARRTQSSTHQAANGIAGLSQEYVGDGEQHIMSFDVQDTIDLAVDDVSTTSAQPMQNGSVLTSFRTDTEIAGRDPYMPRERELQRWDAGADSSIDMSLEDSGDAGWDQFAANQRLYGVESTYDEDIYTTAIDRDDPGYKRREAEAARIAREIEGSAPSNAHVAEERRVNADRDNGLDEEEKYSGVRREAGNPLPKRGAGSYVPPSQRPISNAPTIRGAPFDPAIISLEKPTQPTANPANASEKIAGSAETVEAPNFTHAEPSLADSAVKDGLASSEAATAAALLTPKRPTEQTIEEHVKSTADAFKQFANNEKLRQRQLQEQKRMNVRHEKNVRLNDLKKFAANFRLNSRVPDDLVPILAKNREKQLAIQNKAEEAAKEHETKADESKKEKTPTVTPSAPSNSSSVSQVTTAIPVDRLPSFHQQSRSRMSQQNRAPHTQALSPRAPMSHRLPEGTQAYGRAGVPAPQPLPADLRIPSGPAVQQTDRAPLSPTSASRLNVNAFEFRPAASTFTPSGNSPSPQRLDAAPMQEASASFFGKDKNKMDITERKEIDRAFNPIKRISEEVDEHGKKKSVPPPYRTAPTWEVPPTNANASYRDFFPKHQAPSQGPSPMHTPTPNGPMPPHHHQLPPHMQGQPMLNASQRPPFYQQPSHHGQHPPFDPRMQFGSNGSVHSSPRFAQPQIAFTNQMGQIPMGMPPFAGQQMQMPYGTSPSLQYRQVQMPPGGSMMMPGQQHSQVNQMRPGFPGQPQFGGPQMGGVPMMQQGSSGYMNGHPMPQQSYSPMPPHAQPQMPHMQHQGTPSGYSSSPRAGPQMMQHQGSHQGFQPHMAQMQQPPFTPSSGHSHPYHVQHQQRQTSGQGFPSHMTPRQQQAVPHLPSPGMPGGAGPGDEGK